MRKISTSMMAALCTLAFVSAAAAGDDKSKGAPAPKDAPKDAAKDAAKKKAPDTAAQIKPKEPPPADPAAQPPPPPAPAPEVVAAAKASKGTWYCTGEEFAPDGSAMKTKATMRNVVDLDKMWIKGTLTIPKKKGQKRATKMVSYRTYDATEKKWHMIGIDNGGGWGRGWSTGPDAAGKVTWDVESNMGGQVIKGRDYEEPGVKKNTRRFWGEYAMDGKTYVKAYDVTCRK
jgi:hypothetical protein